MNNLLIGGRVRCRRTGRCGELISMGPKVARVDAGDRIFWERKHDLAKGGNPVSETRTYAATLRVLRIIDFLDQRMQGASTKEIHEAVGGVRKATISADLKFLASTGMVESVGQGSQRAHHLTGERVSEASE